MGSQANVLVICRDLERSMNLAGLLDSDGYECSVANKLEEGLFLAETQFFDIAIMFVAGLDDALAHDERAIDRILNLGAQKPRHVIVVGGEELCEDGIDSWFKEPLLTEQLRRRLIALVRLDTMEQELKRRTLSMAAFGIDDDVDISPAQQLRDVRLLYLSESGQDFAEITSYLNDDDYEVTGALTIANAMDYLLGEKDFDAVIINLSSKHVGLLELRDQMRSYPTLFNMPVVIVHDPMDELLMEDLLKDSATDSFVKPINGNELKYAVRSLVQETRYRSRMRGVFAQVRRTLTNDSLTGLYTYGFLRTHLDTVVSECLQRGRDVSIAFFRVENIEAINLAHGCVVGDTLLNRIGSMIGMLVRGEDVPSRYGGRDFVVVLPATSKEAAQFVLDRITGIIQATDFPSADPSNSIKVFLQTGVASLDEGDDGLSLVERAKSVLYAA